MLYLSPNYYVPINDIKIIINLTENESFVSQFKKKLKSKGIDLNETNRRRKRTLIMTNKKKIYLSSINSETLYNRIINNEVRPLKFLDISYKNYIPINNILLIADANTDPIKKIVSDLKERNSVKLFNFSSKRKTTSIIFTTEGEVIISAFDAQTLYNRATKEDDIFVEIGHNNYINSNKIHMITNREHNHIKLKIKAIEELDYKKILKVSKDDKPKTALFCENNFVVLSKVNPDTIQKNIKKSQF